MSLGPFSSHAGSGSNRETSRISVSSEIKESVASARDSTPPTRPSPNSASPTSSSRSSPPRGSPPPSRSRPSPSATRSPGATSAARPRPDRARRSASVCRCSSGSRGGRDLKRRAARPARPRGLVLLPTRELAVQVHEVLKPLGAALGLHVNAVYGGADIERQMKSLRRGCDVIIATPGRLIDLGDRGEVNVENLDVLVLDEADRMADMGFMPQVEWVLRRSPTGRTRRCCSRRPLTARSTAWSSAISPIRSSTRWRATPRRSR